MPHYTFERLRPECAALWVRMQARPECAAAAERTARKLIGLRRNVRTSRLGLACHWFVMAALHERESGADFTTYLATASHPQAQRQRALLHRFCSLDNDWRRHKNRLPKLRPR